MSFDTAVLKEVKEIKTESEKNKVVKRIRPSWYHEAKNGRIIIEIPTLSRILMSETKMFSCADLSQGARFDVKRGCWRTDSLDNFIENIITEKLDNEGLWDPKPLAAAKKFINIKIFDNDLMDNPFNLSKPNLTNFKNGTYDILTDTMKPHDPLDFIAQGHDYEIHPESASEPTRTITWLNDLTGDEKSAQHLIELIGYCFYRSYEPFQNITILQGGGQNGKSTFLNILGQILNERNISNASLSDLADQQNRFSKASLFQKEANLFADIGSEFLKSTSVTKALTGWDKIFAENKHKDPFMFRNFAKLIFSANKLPAFNDFTDGFERRLNVIPFPVKIDDDFKSKHDLKLIEKEIPDFAVHCMREFKKALDRKEFTQSDSMKEAKAKWLKEANHISRFLEEYCKLDFEEEDGDSSKSVYEKYTSFCWLESIKVMSQPNFTKELENHGVYKKLMKRNGTRVRRYVHLFLKSESEIE